MDKRDILTRLEGLKLSMDSLEQMERDFESWERDDEEDQEFIKLVSKITGVLKFPVNPTPRKSTPADIKMADTWSLLVLAAWKAHQANTLRVAEDIEAGRDETYGPLTVFEE